MENVKVVCKPTSWFKSRAIGLGLLLLGFGIYFFYDASVGYPEKNEIFFTHKAFDSAGQTIEKVFNKAQWKQITNKAAIDFQGYPVPKTTDPQTTPWPPELKDYDLMKKGWHDAWLAYTSRLHLGITPIETPFDQGKITEQWIAGIISCLLALFCVGLLVRTLGRTMSINDETITAAGQQFSITDITRLDMRKWKHKGIAYASVNNRRVRLDGFCYGGFSKSDENQNADAFMNALLANYHGEIIDYQESEPSTTDGGTQE